MNAQHLGAFFWLRWRLLVNQVKRGGIANKVILVLMAAGGLFASLFLLVAGFLIGLFALEEAPTPVLMYAWDAMILLFLFVWTIGLLSDLQRSEALSLEKFLHLPVSVFGVFALNYLSSLFSLNLIVFVPAMIGIAVGLVFSKGPAMLLLFPLLLGFLLMVTALTYQFQGWLASLMVNKRRRRTIIVMITFAFILIVQLPNLLNVVRPWEGDRQGTERLKKERAEVDRAVSAKEITQEEAKERYARAGREQSERIAAEGRQTWKQVEEIAWYANAILPIGWLPFGAMTLADGNVFPAVLGTLGMSLIGAASLWRAYRTTVRLYMGDFTAGSKQPLPAAPPPPNEKPTSAQPRRDGLLAMNLPWLSEPATVIALGTFRSLLRAPEAKMLLLSPVIMLIVFGGIYWRASASMPADTVIPDVVRPLFAFGAIVMFLFTLAQFIGNQFGFDRSGFRIYVLSPTPRRDIMLGKNLAVAPIAFAMCLAAAVLVQILYPMRIDHFVALLPQWISMYLLFCMMANFLSIFAPMAMAQGTLKPANSKFVPILLSMLFISLMPVVLAPTMLPLGIEFGLETLDLLAGVPLNLVLSLLGCAVVVFAYRLVLTWQGTLLQGREQRILEVVTTKPE